MRRLAYFSLTVLFFPRFLPFGQIAYLGLMAASIYLNTASCGLIAPATLAAGNELYAAFAHNSSGNSELWAQHDEGRIRQAAADFIGAPAKNTALVPNFSWAINGIVQSLKGTERILLYKDDFPSLLQPFTINNFPITWVDATDGFNIHLEQLRDAVVQKHFDIVALSHVQWNTGYKLDLKEIGDLCHEHGVLFFVDATQSLGAIPIDLGALHIDVLAASNYKWMNAGFGTGILYTGDSFLAKYPPVVGGFHTDRVRPAGATVPSAASYEPGSPNMYGLLLLYAAMATKNKMGVAQVQQHNNDLMRQLLTGIADLPISILGQHTMTNRASIVLLKDENGLGAWLKQNNFIVTQRNGMLRVSTHFHNTAEEVAALIGCLQAKFE
jgi:cysteine desulfurase / selenocysteine lyase